MTATCMPATAASAPRAKGFVRVAVQRVIAFLSAVQGRRDMHVLAGMDDRMLSDIGLTRGDVRDASNSPVWQDPTAILVARAQERRRGRFFGGGFRTQIVEAPSLAPHGANDMVEWPIYAPRC